ncbi:restriction endonuclease subunit S [Flammeovirga sp. SubArs3]|uniref:restriction endonuclease subunit S n=1 Tax=Flammeovirga sp. SubArs3 TaxID=2995316 RepID=UPI00248AC51B|nr:restriction endonuclease subunit S [Flammeovirga sp. SubArs3]
MTHSHIIEYFKELSIHPKNAEELKGLILQLAVEGKLTEKWREENPNVEPASELLKRIQEEKAQLIKEKKIKKEKTLPVIDEGEIPFYLPNSWRWSRLGNISNYGKTIKAESSDVEQDIWVLELEDIEKRTSKLLKKVFYKDRIFKSSKNWFSKGDVLYGKLRPYLDKVIVADERGVCSTEIIPIKLFGSIYPDYIRLFLKSSFFINYANRSTHGMRMPRLGTESAKKAIIGIPPEQEQKAIVQIVKQLFSEIEQLEEQTKKRIQLKEDFATSSLQQLTSSDTENAWTFLKPHFQTFYTTQPNVKKLREAILQLAVQGKLTHHWRKENPNVEPASELLKRIQEEKAQLIKEKKIKKEKALPEITEEEIPYELPEGWSWCRMQDISIKLGAGSTPSGGKSAYVEEGIKFFRSQNIYNDGLRLENVALITDAIHEKMKGTKVLPKDLLLNITGGSIGRCTLVPDDFDTANVSQHVAIVRLQELGLSSFIHTLIISPQFQQTIMDVQVGVSREGLSMTKLKQFLVPLPPLEEVQAIKDITNNLLALCYQLETSLSEKEGVELDWMKSVING